MSLLGATPDPQNTRSAAFERALRWAIPADISQEERRNGQMLLYLSLVGLLVFSATGLGNLIRGVPLVGLINLLFALLLPGTFPVMRQTRSVWWSQQYLMAVLWVLLVCAAWYKGGLASTPLYWAAPLSILASILNTRRGALLWVAALSVIPFGLAAVQDPAQWPQGAKSPWLYATMHAGLCWMMLLLANLFEGRRAQTQRHLQASEQALDQHNRDMRLLLDHAEQGFLTLDRRGHIQGQRSAVIEQWFGPVVEGISFGQLLERLDRNCAAWFDLGWAELVDAQLPQELCLEQLPSQLTDPARSLSLRYKPLWPEGQPAPEGRSFVMVILTDVTQQRRQQQAEEARRELAAIFERVTADRAGFLEFFQETQHLLEDLRLAPQELHLQHHLLHTIKGNCAIYGVSSVARACDQLEQRSAERRAPCTAQELAWLLDTWGRLRCHIEQWLRDPGGQHLELSQMQRLALEALLARQAPAAQITHLLRSWALEPTHSRLERQAAHAQRLARRLGKAPLQVDIQDHGLRVAPEAWGRFWPAFLHILRNCLDHGLHSPQERRALGLPGPARLVLRTQHQHPWFVLTVEDNGRGMDWAGLADKARALGLPCDTQEQLTEAMFSHGVTTCAHGSELSGRGVGMGAARQAVREGGGELWVHSDAGQGTRFTFRWPAARFLGPASPPPGAPRVTTRDMEMRL